MRSYYDTSFLVSAYLRDSNSEQAVAVLQKIKEPIPLTPILRHELRNAIRLCTFRREITPAQCGRALQDLDDDLQHGVLQEVPLPWPELWRQAENLGSRYTGKLGARGMDLLHVAAALTLGATDFFTFDIRQTSLARKAGLHLN